MSIRRYITDFYNQTLLYVASILFFLEDTRFFLPLENIMKNEA